MPALVEDGGLCTGEVCLLEDNFNFAGEVSMPALLEEGLVSIGEVTMLALGVFSECMQVLLEEAGLSTRKVFAWPFLGCCAGHWCGSVFFGEAFPVVNEGVCLSVVAHHPLLDFQANTMPPLNTPVHLSH